MVIKKNIFTLELKLLLFSLVSLFILKIFFIKQFDLILITTFFDILIFVFIFFVFILFKNIFSKILFHVIYVFNFILFSFYYIFFYDVSQRGILISKIKLDSIIFVLKNIISLKLVFIVFLALFIVYFLSFFILKNKKLFLSSSFLKIFSLISIFLFLFLILLFNLNYNPYADVVLNFKNSFSYIPLEDDSKDLSLFSNNSSIFPDSKLEVKYKKIILLIGEEWMFSSFVKDSQSLENNFFKRIKNDTHFYSNYHTSNQDSRTAIYTLLTSQFIPFEAYLDSTYSIYLDKIKNSPSLVNYFNDNNYSTFFVVSSIEKPDIATPFNWNEIITLKEDVYNSNKYYCSSLFTYETSCEDLSIFEDVKEKIISDENIFLVQEFIYGHSYKHIIDTKKSRTQYYNEYFNNLYDFLEKESLLEDTLIIITSDHGSRAYNEMISPEGYHIPFLVVSNNLDYLENNSLLSHLDFKDILYKYILGIDYIPNNESIMFTGGTNSDLLGFITKENDFGIINSSKSLLINYSKKDLSIKEKSQNHYSYYNFLKNNFK